MDQVLPYDSMDQGLPLAGDMDNYPSDANILEFNNDYMDFVENVDQMVRELRGTMSILMVSLPISKSV